MKIITTILLFTLISPTFGQGIGTGGGKGPNQDAAYGRCVEADARVALLEEEFVKMYDRNYNDQKDFSILIERIIVDSTFQILDRMHKHNHTKNGDTCTETESRSGSIVLSKRPHKKAEMVVLKEILKVYKEQKNITPRCLQFQNRIHNIETLEHVLKFYE